jgi:shikimate kinase
VQNSRQVHNLALIGFMGTGKSSVGRLAAEQLHFDFIDTDDFIETQTGKTISDIFAQNGEDAFRKLEEDAGRALLSKRQVVISAGGGFVTNPDNLANLKTHALVICLWASPETILERISTQTHRPLLQTPDPLGKIRELLEQRSAAYHQADAMIHTGFRSPREVAQQVLHQFWLARQSDDR